MYNSKLMTQNYAKKRHDIARLRSRRLGVVSEADVNPTPAQPRWADSSTLPRSDAAEEVRIGPELPRTPFSHQNGGQIKRDTFVSQLRQVI
ncbi:hypothetical protein MKZ38_000048 [Zalerion maritima]|uniref:Uncharacterized protein n=1 Tax=Zalerion maritima TaxID=339359 RepID=A0AAD5WUW8_9PEZI|nr:hypothetical protein MKZ38_000048 [Zalerion maritima]